jgi:hypothetical protein
MHASLIINPSSSFNPRSLFARLIAQAPNLRSYVHALGACTRAGDWRRAEKLLREARDTERVWGGSTPPQGVRALRCVAFTAAVSALASAGETGRAQRMLEGMVAAGAAPAPATFRVLAAAFARRDDWRCCVALLRRMPVYNLRPDRAARALLTRSCARLVEGSTATQAVREVQQGGERPDALLYGALTAAMAARRDLDPTAAAAAAAAMYRIARDDEVPMATAVDVPTVLAVLGACERAGGGAGALHAAEEVMAHLTSRHVRPDERAEVAEAAFSSLLVLYAEREATEAIRGYDGYDGDGGECMAVRDALRRVREAGLLVTRSAEAQAEMEDSDTWHALLATAAAKVGDAAVRRRVNVSECVCLLMDMQSAGVAPTAAAYKALVLACLRGGAGAATAERFLEMAAEAHVQPDVSTFNTMLACHIRSRDAQGATRWFRIMQGGGGTAWADVWQPCAPDAYTLSALLACHPPAAQVQQWWAELVDDGCVRADAVAWTAKINALAAAGCGMEAVRAFEEMTAAAAAAESATDAATLAPTAATFRCVAEALALLPPETALPHATEVLDQTLAAVPPGELNGALCDAFATLFERLGQPAAVHRVRAAERHAMQQAAAAVALTAATCPAVGACRQMPGTADITRTMGIGGNGGDGGGGEYRVSVVPRMSAAAGHDNAGCDAPDCPVLMELSAGHCAGPHSTMRMVDFQMHLLDL